ncbi:MAG: HAMP domain-containing sensor histidine kinase [Candidatus Promineifilaceae bacterium]
MSPPQTNELDQQLAPYHDELRLLQEELLAANTELNQLKQFRSFLLSMLAHDMRTPLAAIRGYSELLLRLINTNQAAPIPPKAVTFADNIRNITDQMTWLICDIIDLDQSEKGVLTFSQESCDLHRVINDTLGMMASIIKLQQLTLLLELESSDLFVTADPQRIRQITNNLIGNAIKYTPNGGQITISTSVEDEFAVLAVTDNGPGLEADQIEKIFQPYYRTKSARSSNILGSGLGLHIVKTLVEAQNGRVGVVSEIGRGSTFTVRLPL